MVALKHTDWELMQWLIFAMTIFLNWILVMFSIYFSNTQKKKKKPKQTKQKKFFNKNVVLPLVLQRYRNVFVVTAGCEQSALSPDTENRFLMCIFSFSTLEMFDVTGRSPVCEPQRGAWNIPSLELQ